MITETSDPVRHVARLVLGLLLVMLPLTGHAQTTTPEPVAPPTSTTPAPTGTTPPVGPGETLVTPDRQKPPPVDGAATLKLNFAYDTTIYDLVKFFADAKRMNFILGDVKELEGKKVQIISHDDVTVDAAYEAFLSALQVSGFTTSTVGRTTKIVKAQEASQSPIRVGRGEPSVYTDSFVTQLITLKNVAVGDVQKVVTSMAPPEAKIVAYQPANTLIITDTANNLRKIYQVLTELDVSAPESTMVIYQIEFATAAEIKAVIEELYGVAEEATNDRRAGRASSRSSRSSSSTRRPTRSSRSTTPAETESMTAGAESKYISKVLDDERTNALIVLANEDGHAAVIDLIAKLDVDVDPSNRAQIHVVYLENAKAEEVAQVLAELSQERGARRQPARPGAGAGAPRVPRTPVDDGEGGDGSESSAIAAFDSGMRIAADDNTNSLVIIANVEDFRVVDSVIKKLDIKRKQVFVDAVILELASDDSFELGLAAHLPVSPSEDAVGFVGGQYGTQSLGLTQDLLTGLAVGVFGETVDVPISDGAGGVINTPIPAFGIVLNALRTNSSVNIVSNPNILTLDNQEAEIVVGRRIPFPTTAGLNNLGQPVVSYQREDVAITLKVTPRVNSSNFVTLETEVEVQEIEEDDQGLNINQSGPITSKRQEKTTVLVRDNQTVVLGGLVSTTDTDVETKVPVLGDVPVIGALFRGKRTGSRKSNLLIFLTPHIIEDVEDMLEVQRVKEAQRQEFMRRFYGRSRDAYISEMRSLLRYSMNNIDQPSMFRGPEVVTDELELDGVPLSDETIDALNAGLNSGEFEPGDGAGEIPGDDDLIILDELEPEPVPMDEGPVPDAPPPAEAPPAAPPEGG